MKAQKKERAPARAQEEDTGNGDSPRQSLGQVAYDQIRRDIITCRLKPGSVVSEARLAEAYGLGLAPIRNALSKLAQESFIIVQSRKGAVVAPVTLRSISDVFDMRMFLEPSAAGRAAGNLRADELAELERICDIEYVHADRDSTSAFIRANKEFHMLVAAGARNQRLLTTLGQLHDEIERLVHLGLIYRDRSQEHQSEHRELVVALKAGDAKAAEQMTARQIEESRRMVLDAAITNTQLASVNIDAFGANNISNIDL